MKNYLAFIYQTSQMALGIPFYDQIFDYFSTYFWLYHPGDPDHSGLCMDIYGLYMAICVAIHGPVCPDMAIYVLYMDICRVVGVTGMIEPKIGRKIVKKIDHKMRSRMPFGMFGI